jgi:hypothetical protein
MFELQEMLRGIAKPKPVLDATLDGGGEGSALAGADTYTLTDIKLKTAAIIQQWTETDDLEDGETLADRLLAMIVGIADANKDGDISEDEQGVLEIALNCAFDYLTKFGVEDDDAGALLNDWDADAADRIRDLLAASLPEGEAADADIDDFAFSEDQEPVFDAVYKKRLVVRNGKKVRINKRVSGTVRLTAKQKVAIRKAQLKSHNAAAMMRRAKSIRVRKKMGL